MDLLAQKNTRLQIIKIRVGTEKVRRSLLHTLSRPRGKRRRRITISILHLPAVPRELVRRLSRLDGMAFCAFDVGRDPGGQGPKAGT